MTTFPKPAPVLAVTTGRLPALLLTPLVLIVALVIIVALQSLPGLERYGLTVTEMLIRVAAVVGISIFVGNSGILSFGHVGFMCIGAYGTAWATTSPMWKEIMLPALPVILQGHSYPWLVGVMFGAGLAGVVAVVLGLGILRLTGAAATIATFAFLMVVNSLYANWDAMTAGTSSVVGIPTVMTPWTALPFATLAIALAALFKASRFGLMLRASRDEAVAAAAAGINIFGMRMLALILSALICGMAGALYGHLLGFLSPDSLYMNLTFITLAMLVIGGMGSLSGAVVGVLAVTAVIEILRLAEGGVTLGGMQFAAPAGVQELGLAIMLATSIVLRPKGLMRGKEIADLMRAR